MDAKQIREWVAALQAIHTATGRIEMPGAQLRNWARDTLAKLTSAALDANNLEEISEAFLASSQDTQFAVDTELLEYQRGREEVSRFPAKSDAPSVLRWLEQTASPYPLVDTANTLSAPALVNPYSSPTNYLQHPTIDILDQETITRISARDTGA